MLKTYNEIIGLNNTLAGMARDRWPFGITLAKNIKIMDKIVLDYNEKRQAVIDEYAKRDDEGNILGIMQDVPVKEGEEPRQERIKQPRRIDETEWTDRASFEAKLDELNKQSVELELMPVDVNTTFFSNQANRDMTVAQHLDANAEPSLVLYLEEYGFFKNLNLQA